MTRKEDMFLSCLPPLLPHGMCFTLGTFSSCTLFYEGLVRTIFVVMVISRDTLI